MTIDNHQIIREIAESNYALLYLIKDKRDRHKVLKIARNAENEMNALIAREFKILSEFKHPNIVRAYSFGSTKAGEAYFIMEYISGVPINEYFKGFSEEFLCATLQIIQGLGAFHYKGFAHGDLKPQNILYCPEEKKSVLIDFGFAGIPSETIHLGGTIGYMAPEVIKGTSINQRSDLYSLGIMMYEILSGLKYDDFHPLKQIPKEINDLLNRLLSPEPSLRPTINAIFLTLSRFTSSLSLKLPTYDIPVPTTGFVPIPQNILERIKALQGTTLVISGSIGSGKTRTLQELKFTYLCTGSSVLLHDAKSKTKLLPRLFELVGKRESLISKNTTGRFQVFEKILRLLEEVSKRRHMALLIDDIDELPAYEQELIRYIACGNRNGGISLIITSESPDPFEGLDFTKLPLRPFLKEEVSSLLKRTFFEMEFIGESKKAGLHDFAQWLHEESGGNPLFIAEILGILFREKAIRFHSHRWQVRLDLLFAVSVPGKLQDIIDIKIAALSNNQRTLLQLLSLINHPLDRFLIGSVIDAVDEKDIEKLKQIGLVREAKMNGKWKISTQNRLAASIAKKSIPSNKKRKWRREIIGLLQSSISRQNEYLELLAELLLHEKDAENAQKRLLELAKEAGSICNYHSALQYYMAILECENSLFRKETPETLLKIAHFNQLLGKNETALAFYEKALLSRTSEYIADIYTGMAKSRVALGDYSEAAQCFRKALTHSANKETQDHIKVAVYSLLYLPQFSEIKTLLNPAFPSVKKSAEAKLLSETMYYQALYEWLRGKIDDGIEKARRALEISREGKLEIHHAFISCLIAFLYQQKGNIDAALKSIAAAIAAFEKNRLTTILPFVLNRQALLYIDIARFSESEKTLQNAYSLAQQTNNAAARHAIAANLGRMNELLGNFNAAIGFYSEAQELRQKNPMIAYMMALVNYKKGELKKARELINAKLKESDEIPYLLAKALIAQSMGNDDDAESAINKSLARIHSEIHDVLLKREFFLCTAHIYYMRAEHKKSLSFAREAQRLSPAKSREFLVSSAFIALNRFFLKQSDLLILSEIKEQLSKIGCHYDYALVAKMEIDALLKGKVDKNLLKYLVTEFESIQKIQKALGIIEDEKRISDTQAKLFPSMAKAYKQRTISDTYLDTLSSISELISINLGEPNFMQTTIDLILKATGAERGAFFLKSTRGMKFCAGRALDRTTLKDARELSKTVIKEIRKNKIIYSPSALDDPKYNKKKSVKAHKIRSLLCIPLSANDNVIGAIYLDSKTKKDIFNKQDRDFLITVSRIIASVVEKSIEFRSLSEENILLRSQMIEKIGEGYIIGTSAPMKKLYRMIESIAETPSPVLLLGETGTGKGMLARLIHLKSKRKRNKFITINCGTIPESLLESELFGHKRGSFTGAVTDKIGLLEEAELGSVFLDEIANTTPSFQAKLLEAIEEKRIRRIGETRTRSIDVRFLFATNKNLEKEVEERRFRKDLFYRINVFTISVPPLRERVKDIPVLAEFFLDRYRNEMNKQVDGFTIATAQYLKEYAWPGNVRELQNAIERAVVLTRDKLISIRDLGLGKGKSKKPLSFEETKKLAIGDALRYNDWKIAKTAEQLGIGRATLWRYIKEFGLKKES
jgi:Nif-specific regulatory protein